MVGRAVLVADKELLPKRKEPRLLDCWMVGTALPLPFIVGEALFHRLLGFTSAECDLISHG
jgi:hypothetical protein